MSSLVRKVRQNPVGRVVVDVFDWYPAHYPAEERKLLRKLDLCILVFACLSFFCKYLDQSNITNAYVSGLKEDINAGGNALNYFNVAYYTAYVVGQIPLMALQTRPRLAPYLLPTLEIVWAVLTFCQSRVTKLWQMYLLRALVGFFEAPSFGGTHLILGSWYRKEELFKRAGVWFMGNSLGSMFSGYLQAAAYNGLSGVHGLAGWRWLFVIDGVITLPIAFIGFAFFPGLPASPRRWFLKEEELELAKRRLPQREEPQITWKTVKTTLSRPMWWICVPAYVCMIQASYWLSYMSLWLKAEGFSVTLVNILPTFMNLTQAFASWMGTTLAGVISIPLLWTGQFVCSMFGAICLTIWYIPNGLKFFAFYFAGLSYSASPILYSWINHTLADQTAERGLIISSMMTLGYSTYVWVPLFTFPTVEAPQFKHGYPATVVFTFALWAVVLFGIWYMARRQAREAKARGTGGDADVENRGDGEGTTVIGSESGSESGKEKLDEAETPGTPGTLTPTTLREEKGAA